MLDFMASECGHWGRRAFMQGRTFSGQESLWGGRDREGSAQGALVWQELKQSAGICLLSCQCAAQVPWPLVA